MKKGEKKMRPEYRSYERTQKSIKRLWDLKYLKEILEKEIELGKINPHWAIYDEDDRIRYAMEKLKDKPLSKEEQILNKYSQYSREASESVVSDRYSLENLPFTDLEAMSEEETLESLREVKHLRILIHKLQKIEAKDMTPKDSKTLQNAIKEKEALEIKIFKGNIYLANEFVSTNLKDVLVETEDVVQICCEALWKSIKQYTPAKKGFSRFAHESMDNAVKESFKDLTGEEWEYYKYRILIQNILDYVSQRVGEQVDIYDISDMELLDIPEGIAYEIMEECYNQSELSMSEEESEDFLRQQDYVNQLGEDEREDIPSIFGTQPGENIEKKVLLSDLKVQLEKLLNELPKREKKVLVLRYGLEGQVEKTQNEIGEEIHVSHSRVGQIESQALRKLRHPYRKKIIKNYLEP